MKMSTFERLSKKNKKFNKTIKMECSVLNHHPIVFAPFCLTDTAPYSVFSYFLTKYRPTKRTSTHEMNIFLFDNENFAKNVKSFEF